MAVALSSSRAALVSLPLAVISVHAALSSVRMAASPEVSESAVHCCIRAFVSVHLQLHLQTLLCQYHLVYF